MNRWLVRLAAAAVITVTIAAVCQEMEKPKKEREWKGKVGVVPYNFGIPTLQRLKETFWNTEESRIFTESFFGIGWSINIYALLEKMRMVEEYYASEDDFLMPTPSLKELLEHRPANVQPGL